MRIEPTPAFEDLLGHAVLLVLAAAQFTFDLHVCAFLQSRCETRDLPLATQRCHSVLDSHAPWVFFHEVFVATEKTV